MRKTYELAKFFFVSVPLACVLIATANVWFETKRLWKKIFGS